MEEGYNFQSLVLYLQQEIKSVWEHKLKLTLNQPQIEKIIREIGEALGITGRF